MKNPKIINFPITQYIQLIEDLSIREFAGRSTVLQKGGYGVLLNENDIETLWDISVEQKEKCLALYESAQESNDFLALIAGYPCILSENDFIRKEPISSIVPWEII